MRLYVAGPMTGIPQFNFPAFDSMAARLRDLGHEVQSPAEMDDPATRVAALASPDGAPGSGSTNGETWGDFLARDVKLLADGKIEGVVVLEGWMHSKGARLETFVASLKGIPTFKLTERDLWPVHELELARAWAGRGDLFFDHAYSGAQRR